MLEQHPGIRVVFTDIQMPGSMDGLALSHYVRESLATNCYRYHFGERKRCSGRTSQ